MGTLNGKRVVAGGVVAGLVALVGEMLLEPLAGGQMEAWFEALGATPPGEAAMLAYAAMGLVLGVVAVWLYAAARPRLAAGPRTALVVGLAVWALACGIPNVHMFALGIMPAGLFWLSTAWTVVQIPVATLAGAWVYREEPAGTAARAGALTGAAQAR